MQSTLANHSHGKYRSPFEVSRRKCATNSRLARPCGISQCRSSSAWNSCGSRPAPRLTLGSKASKTGKLRRGGPCRSRKSCVLVTPTARDNRARRNLARRGPGRLRRRGQSGPNPCWMQAPWRPPSCSWSRPQTSCGASNGRSAVHTGGDKCTPRHPSP